jgi:hypothetical protein
VILLRPIKYGAITSLGK